MRRSTQRAAVQACVFLAISSAASSNDEMGQGHTPGMLSGVPLAETSGNAMAQGHTPGKSRNMHMRRAKSTRRVARTAADGSIFAEDPGATDIDQDMHLRRDQSDRRAALTSADGSIFAEDGGGTKISRTLHMRRVKSDRRSARASVDGAILAENAGATDIGGSRAKTMQSANFEPKPLVNLKLKVEDVAVKVVNNVHVHGSLAWAHANAEANVNRSDQSSAALRETDLQVPVMPGVRSESLTERQKRQVRANARSKLKQLGKWNFGSRDYDCDGDGTRDCGYFDYKKLTCKNSPVCGHEFKLGDYRAHHSCRCMKCFDAASTAAAVAPVDPVIKKFFYGRWRGWNKLLDTCAPWLMPKNDADIQTILRYAKEHKFTVRPTGATHSAGGLVTNWENKNVLVVSLAEYQAPGEWEYSLQEKTKGQATVKVNAGWTYLQLYAKIRPRDYFLPTQNAGPGFALGGIISNCVHSGVYKAGFVHQFVKKVRVMLHDGTIREISDEKELRFWRNSYGLLGFALGFEFSLDYRPKFQQYTIKKKVKWTEEGFWNFLKQDSHGDFSEDVISAGDAGDRKAIFGEWFFDPYEAKQGEATMLAIVWRANENATEPNVRSKKPLFIKTQYWKKQNKPVVDEILTEYPQNGKPKFPVLSKFNVAVRHWGGPKVLPTGLRPNDIWARFPKIWTQSALGGTALTIWNNRRSLNDGFFAYKIPNVVYGAYFMEPKYVWEAMNVLVADYDAQKDDPLFAWNGPPELRFVTIIDDAELNPVPPGFWAVSEFLAFPITGKSDQGWKAAFKRIEDEWTRKFNAIPHIAKFWGFGNTSAGLLEPYQQDQACKIYTDTQKNTFNEYRKTQDPGNLFYGGDAVNLLKRC